MITSMLVNPRIALEVECPWYLYNAVNIPPVVGICIDVHALGIRTLYVQSCSVYAVSDYTV